MKQSVALLCFQNCQKKMDSLLSTVGFYVLGSCYLFNHQKYGVRISLKRQQLNFNHCTVAEWSKASPTDLLTAGSNPSGVLFIFLQFFQTFRANCPFARSCAKMGLCLSFSKRFRVPLHVVKVHVLLRALYVTFIWKIAILWHKKAGFFQFLCL